jgi:hypothetical protein
MLPNRQSEHNIWRWLPTGLIGVFSLLTTVLLLFLMVSLVTAVWVDVRRNLSFDGKANRTTSATQICTDSPSALLFDQGGPTELDRSRKDALQQDGSASKGPGGSGQSSDGLSNAMGAVGLAVTVLTLLLSLGSLWLAQQHKRIEEEIRRVDSQLDRFKLYDELQSIHQAALSEWVTNSLPKGGTEALNLTFELAQHLEGLMLDDVGKRRQSFDKLRAWLSPIEDQPPDPDVLAYTENCHDLAVQRQIIRGNVKNFSDLRRFETQGVYCRIFNEADVRRHVETMRDKSPSAP